MPETLLFKYPILFTFGVRLVFRRAAQGLPVKGSSHLGTREKKAFFLYHRSAWIGRPDSDRAVISPFGAGWTAVPGTVLLMGLGLAGQRSLRR